MPTLSPQLRRILENTIKAARREAEAGAAAALAYLSVADVEPGSHLSPEQRKLRTRLRAHAVQLGDGQKGRAFTSLSRLEHETAYEQWHRMLFARFLAEKDNDLLLEPGGMAISLAEASELAAEEKMDLWAYAARCAQAMLPQVFRAEDPVLAIELPPEHRIAIERLVQDLPSEVFTADDSLGWVYQFWRADEKDAVNKAEEKINADTLPAVTQLFTEHYMVKFLLHNTLGAWWADRRMKDESCCRNFATEDEARAAFALPGVEWTYLRFVWDEESSSFILPPSSTFPGWPDTVRELKCLDPCCGSGHILVALLQILVALRRAEEGLSAEEAVRAVLTENLHGLEIDARCSQLAAFNVAFAAWKITKQAVELPPLQIACSGLTVGGTREEWMQAIDSTGSELRFFLGQLYDLFKKAPDLGSLINPARLIGGSMHSDKLDPLMAMLDSALARDEALKRTLVPEEYERGVTAQGMARATQLLSGKYHLTVTNVPYLGRGNQGDELKQFIETHYPTGKADLATAFVLRCLEFCADGGSTALVTPQNWLFLGSYKKLREHLLQRVQWEFVARLGERGFESPAAAGAFVAMFTLTRVSPNSAHQLAGIDASDEKTPHSKAICLREGAMTWISQQEQLNNPDHRITISEGSGLPLLSKLADSFLGLGTGDYPHYGRYFWEFDMVNELWTFQQCSIGMTMDFGGREHVVAWDPVTDRVRGMTDSEREQIHNQDQSGRQAWSRRGVAVGLMRQLKATIYTGEKFEKALAAIVPKNDAHLLPILAFTSSPEFNVAVRRLDQKMIVANGTLVKVPFDLAHWQTVAAEKYPQGIPKPHSDDPTQWLFSGHPRGATEPLQVAVARLLGYRWPRQTGSEFVDCPSLGPDGLEAFADQDGIICLSQIGGEEAATERLPLLLAAAYGGDWSAARLEGLLDAVGYNHKTLEDWLRDKFFEQHCALFDRPFIWQIWDGLPRGFSALVNYHRLAAPSGDGRKTLEKLTYTYLGDWITRQQDGVRQGVGGADDRLAAALELKKRLVAILTGEPPYDIFVRWKPLHQQGLGWEPDINDGVRFNIRPFLASDLPGGKRGAGILRIKPNIKWEKDRGKEPRRLRDEFPWFWGWDGKTEDFPGSDTFTGDRWNDCHYTTKAKRSAREARKTT